MTTRKVTTLRTQDGTPIACAYFLLCDHEAIGVTKVGVLGYVPVCERCANKLGLEVVPASQVEVTQ